MKKRMISVLSCFLMLAVLFTGCGASSSSGSTNTADPTGSSGTGEHYEYLVGASTMAGVNYQWVTLVSELVNQYSDLVTLNPITTTGSAENIHLIESGEAAFGIGPIATVLSAVNGEADWAGKPVSDLEFAYFVIPDYFQVYVRADSDYETISDLVGKTVTFGDLGSGLLSNTERCMNALGYTREDFDMEFLTPADAMAALSEGWLDCCFCYGSPSQSTVAEFAAGPVGLKVLQLTDEEVQKACEAVPIFMPGVMEKSYDGIPPINTFGGCTILWSQADVPDEVTYEIAKIVNEHVDDISATFAMGPYSDIKYAVDAVSIIPMAGGLEQYMKELDLID